MNQRKRTAKPHRQLHRAQPSRSAAFRRRAAAPVLVVLLGGATAAVMAVSPEAAKTEAGLSGQAAAPTSVRQRIGARLGVIGEPWSTIAPKGSTSSRKSPTAPAPNSAPPPRLSWAPPALISPITVTVGPGKRSLKLDPLHDYRVVLPRTSVDLGGGVTITGGRNVVIIGGVISVPSRSEVPTDNLRRGLYLKGQTGTIHVEGVHLTGDLSDGINMDQRLGAIVQLENILIDTVHGSHDTHHADVIQTWAGPRILRVDGLRGDTQYQGMFLLPNQQWDSGPAPEEFVVRRSLIQMEPNSAYALWLPHGSEWMDSAGLTVQLPPGRSTSKLSWPNSHLGLTTVSDTGADPIDQGEPGTNYRSPGYVSTS